MALAACSDSFTPPKLPDLYKDPYDFAVVVPPFGDGGTDMAKTTAADMAHGPDTD
ncbi:MAG: hypothetical protein JWN44_1686 [Myxococcales bacterium]|nr:hypothetical protein [Myxococcales bacterium]